MDSSTHQSYQQQQQQQHQNHQPNSGLLRFRSAPSSFLANFTDGVDCGVNKGGFESDRLISRFMNSSGANPEIEDKSRAEAAASYANSQQNYSILPPHYPRQSSATGSSAMDSSYELLGMDQHMAGKSINSSLLRQMSSPPGLFANLSVQNGYATMKGVGNYSGMNGTNGEVSSPSNRSKNQISFSSRLPSSLGMLSQISETDHEGVRASSPGNGKLENGNGDARFYSAGFPYGSWNDSSHFTDNFSGMKREQDSDKKLFSNTQNGDLGGRVPLLSHHLSLPKSSMEMASMEKYLQFQNSIPCKIRAKRGCATHPRSIAERVRRTRISERMRKLQELVPNMDKQTNTADMLDLAVEYIKDLQKQYKTLSDNRANCKCLNIQKPVPNQVA